jgi:multidrug efflux pump subunit AcrA (membrane-fusion protein)
MFVQVGLRAAHSLSVTIPVEALQEESGEQIVFVQEGDGYRRRIVKTGATLGDQVTVESGVKPGEKVVTRGAYQLLAQWKKG